MIARRRIRAKSAGEIRAGIGRARLVQRLLDGIALNPTSFQAIALRVLMMKVAGAHAGRLEKLAYLRTRSSSVGGDR